MGEDKAVLSKLIVLTEEVRQERQALLEFITCLSSVNDRFIAIAKEYSRFTSLIATRLDGIESKIDNVYLTLDRSSRQPK